MGRGLRRLLTAGATTLVLTAASLGLAAVAQAAVTPGTLVVIVTDSLGAPVVGATMSLSTDAVNWGRYGNISGADGTITATLQPKTYHIQITTPGGLVDYLPGQSDPGPSWTYNVVSGVTLTETEQLSQSGNVEVSLLDKVTGAPVTEGCVFLSGATYNAATFCNRPDGRYSFVAVPLGAHTITVGSTKTHWAPDPVQVDVSPGLVAAPVRLDPAGAITTVIQAADDPSVHPNFCVQPVYAADTLLNHGETANCTYDTVTGSLTIGPLESAPLQLFALSDDYSDSSKPFAPVYGAQWVGASGGTGDQRLAQTFTVAAGTVVNAAPIRLDHAGSITGVVTGPPGAPVDNAPLPDIAVMPYAPQTMLHLNYGPGLAMMTRVGASFQLTGLGPYQWPVLFQDWQGTYAEQWSGGARNRYKASMVSVSAGGTATVNATLAYAAQVFGSFTGNPSPAPTDAWVMAVDAATGDWTGQALVYQNSWWDLGLNPDPVRLISTVDGQLRNLPFTVVPGGPHGQYLVLAPNSAPVGSDPVSLYGAGHVAPPAHPQVRGASGTPARPATPAAPKPAAPLPICGYARPRCM
jgi:hypothetical protein